MKVSSLFRVAALSSVVLTTSDAFMASRPIPGSAYSYSSPTLTTTTTTELNSIPNALDTFTSGMASIFRLPGGVTVDPSLASLPTTTDSTIPSTSSSAQSSRSVRIVQLYDVENSVACRSVRERLTELDLSVALVIPAGYHSRVWSDPSYEYALPAGTEVPRMVVYDETTRSEQVWSGAEEILSYLNALQPQSSVDNEEDKEGGWRAFWELVRTVSNYAASAVRVGRGSFVSPAAQAGAPRPPTPRSSLPSLALKASNAATTGGGAPLVLYSYEGNQFCRLVREVLTELDVPYELRNVGKQSPRREELAKWTGGSTQCPYLIDPSTNVALAESADIIRYLYKTYALWTPPNELLQWFSENVMEVLKPVFQQLAPLQAGSKQEASELYEQRMAVARTELDQEIQSAPVVVYTYEWSPFSSECTALLQNLGVDYKEISLGKEWIPGLMVPGGAEKRAVLLERTDQSSLPHVFIGGTSIGGLFSGTPGVVPGLVQGTALAQALPGWIRPGATAANPAMSSSSNKNNRWATPFFSFQSLQKKSKAALDE
jgi:glutaredoxin